MQPERNQQLRFLSAYFCFRSRPKSVHSGIWLAASSRDLAFSYCGGSRRTGPRVRTRLLFGGRIERGAVVCTRIAR